VSYSLFDKYNENLIGTLRIFAALHYCWCSFVVTMQGTIDLIFNYFYHTYLLYAGIPVKHLEKAVNVYFESVHLFLKYLHSKFVYAIITLKLRT